MSTATTTMRKRPSTTNELIEPSVITFSSDLLTPEEERELLTSFWDCKSELVRVMVRHFPDLRANKPPLEPWPMAQFIRDNVNAERRDVMAIRRLTKPTLLRSVALSAYAEAM